MKASPIYEEIVEQGRRAGLLEGLREGELKGKREAILAILGARFERVSQTMQKQIAGITDEAALTAILDLAATCETLAEVRKRLPKNRARK